MAELELHNVNKNYKLGNKTTFQALADVNISFEKGELVSVIGESGSGKSTLMNIIGGLDSEYTGDIFVAGNDLKGYSDKELDEYRKNKIGFVFQSFNLIPHLTILDNVTIALTLSGVKESEKVKKATAILTRLGLEKHMKKKPTQLSGGQKQRVAIARALINDPSIILADEPTGALDSTTTLQILEILKEIADDGKLVIMVTHSEKVASISSRIVEISDGRIIHDEKKKDYKKLDKSKNEFADLLDNSSASSNSIDQSDSQPIPPDMTPDGDKQCKKKQKVKKTHLSLWSATKLSFHNMWASKTKNVLMAVGVSISLVSMIIMLGFGSGLTDYIDSLANQYSNPLIVTATKKTPKDNTGSGSGDMDFLTPKTFTDEEIDQIILDINAEMTQKGNDYQINKENDVTYGFNIMTGFTQSADVIYDSGEPDTEAVKNNVFYLYTTPSYYNKSNMIAGEISGENEVMFSAAITKALNMKEEEVIGKTVTINIAYGTVKISKEVTISGIVDVSVFSSLLVMYVDYNFLDSMVYQATVDTDTPTHLSPTSIYIQTDSETTTSQITNYLNSRSDISGSVEQQFASMFTGMMSTFSTALAIIAAISLIVAAIMILVALYMSVTERTREIGVLKSIGARRKDIKRIFTTESFLIGILSGIVGILLSLIVGGIFILVLNAILGFAPLTFRWYYFVIAMGISIVISVLSGLYPAAKAAKLDPVESLRHE